MNFFERTRFSQILPLAGLAVTMFVFPCLAQPPYGMSFSIYTDSSPIDIYTLQMQSTVEDNSWGCYHSGYMNTRRLTSPSGRVSISQSSSMTGGTSIAINGEYGQYVALTTGTYYCSCFHNYAGYGTGVPILIGETTERYRLSPGNWGDTYAGYTVCPGHSVHCPGLLVTWLQLPEGTPDPPPWPQYLEMTTLDWRAGLLTWVCVVLPTMSAVVGMCL